MDLTQQVLATITKVATQAILDWKKNDLIPDLEEADDPGRLELSHLPTFPKFEADELVAYIIGFVKMKRIGTIAQLDQEEIYQICIRRLRRKDCSIECSDFLAGTCHGAFDPYALYHCVSIGIIKSSGQFVIDPSKENNDNDNEDFKEVLNV